MQKLGGVLTAVALSLAFSSPAFTRGLPQRRNDLSVVANNLRQTPFFKLLPQTQAEVEQLNQAKEFMNLANLATFVSLDGTTLSINRFDTLRTIVDQTKHTIDKSGTCSRVLAHKTLAYGAGIKTPRQYDKGGRAGSGVDGKLSRFARANSKSDDYKGPSMATVYAEHSPVMLDAKTSEDVDGFITYFGQTLADNPSLSAVHSGQPGDRPVMLLTVKTDALLQTVSPEATTQLKEWFTVTTLAEKEVNAYFHDAAGRMVELAGNNGDGLIEVGVPLKEGLWNDFSGLFENFDWKRGLRKGLKKVGESTLENILPVALVLLAWNQGKSFFTTDGGQEKLILEGVEKAKIAALVKERMKCPTPPKPDTQDYSSSTRKAVNIVATAALLLNNVKPVVDELGGLDKLISWKGFKKLVGRFVTNLYGGKISETDTGKKRMIRTLVNWVAILAMVKAYKGAN